MIPISTLLDKIFVSADFEQKKIGRFFKRFVNFWAKNKFKRYDSTKNKVLYSVTPTDMNDFDDQSKILAKFLSPNKLVGAVEPFLT